MVWRGLAVVFCLQVVLMATPPTASAPAATGTRDVTATDSFAGGFLVASPKMTDPRFAQTVILIVNHDSSGAMGLVINRSFGTGSLKSLLKGFGIEKATVDRTVSLRYGGPVEQARGFVLHSEDYTGPSTRVVGDGVALSTGFDILKALAGGTGPRRAQFLLGYAGWGPGQLEGEMARGDWLSAPADDRLIFSEDLDRVWDEALEHAGTTL